MRYKTVGLIGKPKHDATHTSIKVLIDELNKRNCNILLEANFAAEFDGDLTASTLSEIGFLADLAIVVGGDGHMLGAARVLAEHQIDVVGVNRGNLGFLTDINPDDIHEQLAQIFSDNVYREKRFILEAQVFKEGKLQASHSAINEVVLHHSKVARMMEFEVYVGDDFVFSQRSDGLIIATPTGSTAYSLSGGGPILVPQLDALTLVPMFPHTLSNRPIVVDANNEVTLKISNNNTDTVQISCDSHAVLSVDPGDYIKIHKNKEHLTLVHPPNYNYYNVLRTKLNWGSKLY